MPFKRLLLLSLFVCLFACGTDSKSKELYKEAHEIQEQAIAEIKDIRQQLKGDTTATAQASLSAIEELEETLVEVPGYHLHLPGHEGHNHSHEKTNLTPEQLVEVHKELLVQLKEIKSGLASQ